MINESASRGSLHHGWHKLRIIMYIDDLTDAVVECAEAGGWEVNAGIYYKEQKSEFEFGKLTPAGQNFSFFALMKCSNINSLIEDIDKYYEVFDVDTETYQLLDNKGHGKNGAPYRMGDVLNDMEAVKGMIRNLYHCIRAMKIPDKY